jgi:hypothetical protein
MGCSRWEFAASSRSRIRLNKNDGRLLPQPSWQCCSLPTVSDSPLALWSTVILLAAFGTVLLVAGLAQRLQVSAAIGAGMLTSAVDCAGIGWVLAAALGDDPSGAGESDADGIANPIE